MPRRTVSNNRRSRNSNMSRTNRPTPRPRSSRTLRPSPRPRPRTNSPRQRPIPTPRVSVRAGKIYDILNEKGNRYIGILAEQAAEKFANNNSNKRTFTYSEISDIKRRIQDFLHDWKDLPKEDAKKLFSKTSFNRRIQWIIRTFPRTDTSGLTIAKITENEIV